mgnify:CR=1 FL=1
MDFLRLLRNTRNLKIMVDREMLDPLKKIQLKHSAKNVIDIDGSDNWSSLESEEPAIENAYIDTVR